ncbi:MAG: HU family DNA-binding protein [Alphaproteobacteria bacterium]|nr:HU family DNA-binding protein [Alphaproteobacteria bacterium]
MAKKALMATNKGELVAAVAEMADLSKAKAAEAVEAVLTVATATLKAGQKLALVGFGTFQTAKRKATTGRNPRTGKEIKIAASIQPKFKAGKGLKDAVNKK